MADLMEEVNKWVRLGKGNTVRAELLVGEPGQADDGLYRCPMQVRMWVGKHHHTAYTVAYSMVADALADAILMAVEAALKEEWQQLRRCPELPGWQTEMANDIGAPHITRHD